MAGAELAIRTRYTLRLSDLAGRHFDVVARLSGLDGSVQRLNMPNWVPGSYMIREFASHVDRVQARSGDRPLNCVKEDKSTWRVELEGARDCEVSYRVFAGEQSVRTSYVGDGQAFVNPAGSFLCPIGRESEPLSVELELPEGWSAHSALRRADGPFRFVAENYDRLVDCPLQTGLLTSHAFDVDGVQHEFVFVGSGNHDVARVLEDSARICRAEKQLFGELPIERYLFVLLLTEDRGGGLEHSDSSVLAWPKLKFRPEKDYRKFLTLVAHEYFHLWNVKRMRPAAFGSFDYQNEMYTRLLWVFEGITSYYDQLLPLRAGCYSAKDYLELLAEHIVAENSRGGRHLQSIAESSFDTWIKLYRPSTDSYNTQVSYYERGEVVALLLDLHLRERSGDRKSLDDVMRHMYHEMYKRGELLAEDGFAGAVEAATGIDAGALLRELVEGTGPLDPGAALARMGVELVDDVEDDARDQAWIGAVIESSGGSSVLGHVALGGSAHAAGLMSGDELVAIDGHRVRGDLADRLKLYHCGETVRWSAFRDQRLVEGRMLFLPDPNPKKKIVRISNAGDGAHRAFLAWTGAELGSVDPK